MSGHEGNGVDLGSIYGLLRAVADTVNDLAVRLTRLEDRMDRLEQRMDRLEQRMNRLEATMVTKAELADLRQTVVHYHSSVIGHGILISELETRVGRIEQHLSLSPT